MKKHIIVVSQYASRFHYLKNEQLLEKGTRFSFHHSLEDLEDNETLGKERDTVLLIESRILVEDDFNFCHQTDSNTFSEASSHLYLIALETEDPSKFEVQKRLSDFLIDDSVPINIAQKELYDRIRLAFRIITLQRQIVLEQEQITLVAATDPVTQLASRKRGREIIQNELARVKRGKQGLSLILIDLDHFTEVNDEYDERIGDAVLREIANRIRSNCRNYDSVIRWGGQEFLLISPDASEPDILVIAQRIRFAIANQPVVVNPLVKVDITASFGTLSLNSQDEVNISHLLDALNGALYKAKQEGRNCVRRATGLSQEN